MSRSRAQTVQLYKHEIKKNYDSMGWGLEPPNFPVGTVRQCHKLCGWYHDELNGLTQWVHDK